MSKFNWKLINQPNTVVHCETEEQARELLTEADRMGFRWCHRDKYFDGDIISMTPPKSHSINTIIIIFISTSNI